MIVLTDELLHDHYAHLADQPFFPGIREFMQRTPVVAQAWRGIEAVDVVRSLVGVTNGRRADVGSLRGRLSMSIQTNLVHASDSPESATVELERFFAEGELFDYAHPLETYLNSATERAYGRRG
jgi:nucleoside-diphosphate kinase